MIGFLGETVLRVIWTRRNGAFPGELGLLATGPKFLFDQRLRRDAGRWRVNSGESPMGLVVNVQLMKKVHLNGTGRKCRQPLLEAAKVGRDGVPGEVLASRPQFIEIKIPVFLRFVEVVNQAAFFRVGGRHHAAQQGPELFLLSAPRHDVGNDPDAVRLSRDQDLATFGRGLAAGGFGRRQELT